MTQPNDIAAALEPTTTADHAPALLLRIKVVPGAKRNRLSGMLGDRLKLTVSAPPEDGKANKAVCKLLAESLGIPPRDVAVTAGHSQPTKTLTITGINVDQAARRLATALGE